MKYVLIELNDGSVRLCVAQTVVHGATPTKVKQEKQYFKEVGAFNNLADALNILENGQPI